MTQETQHERPEEATPDTGTTYEPTLDSEGMGDDEQGGAA